MSSVKSSASSSRILSKLSSLIESEHYYEAHQLYRTLYFRMLNANKLRELSQLLYDGAITLLKRDQYNSGADLACLYLDVIAKGQSDDGHSDSMRVNGDNINDNDELLSKIGSLYELIPSKTPERITFTTKALKIERIPVSSVHRQLATVLWHEKNFTESRHHFVHADDSGRDSALMLVEYQITSGFPSEVDLFIAQYVLQVLCFKKSKAKVEQTFQIYTSKHPSIKCCDPPFFLPLLNFLWFLLLAIDSGKSSTFKVLCDLYDATLKRDPSYNDYLTQIGHIYFGIENANAANRGPSGFLGNLLQSLLEDDNESEDDTAGPSRVSHVDVDLD